MIEKTTLNLYNLVWTPLAFPLLVGAGLSVVLTVYLLRRPLPEKARIGVLMLLAGAWWATFYALELVSVGLNAKLLWAKIQYIGIVLFPIATLVMGLLYTERSRLLTHRNLILLTTTGFIILLLVFTTDYHHLFWRTTSLDSHTVPPMLQVEYSVGFWAFMGYVSLLTWTGLGLMLFSFIRSPILHRRQIRILLVSVCVLVTAIGLNAMDIGPAAYLDLQPYAILVVCIAIGWGSYRLQVGDIVPVAYQAVIENIPDAVVILNANHQILKLNIAAKNLIGESENPLVGKLFSECCPEFNEILSRKYADVHNTLELSLAKHGKNNDYEIQHSVVRDGRGRLASQVIIIRDITARIRAEKELEQRHRYLHALWSSVPDAIVVLNADMTVSEWSEGAERIFDVPANSALGCPFASLADLDEGDGIGVESLLKTVWRKDTVTLVESQLSRKDGTKICVLLSGSPLIINDELNGAVIVLTDITNLKDVEASLRHLNEELEHRVEHRTQTLSETNSQLVEEIILHQETEVSLVQRNRELLSFQAAATATSSSLDIVFVLETLTWEMIDLLQVDGCCVYQLESDTNELVAIADYAALIANEPIP